MGLERPTRAAVHQASQRLLLKGLRNLPLSTKPKNLPPILAIPGLGPWSPHIMRLRVQVLGSQAELQFSSRRPSTGTARPTVGSGPVPRRQNDSSSSGPERSVSGTKRLARDLNPSGRAVRGGPGRPISGSGGSGRSVGSSGGPGRPVNSPHDLRRSVSGSLPPRRSLSGSG